MPAVIEWTGKKTVEGIAYASDVLFLAYLAVREFVSPRQPGRSEVHKALTRQILRIGVDALPVVGAMALMLGLIVIIQAGLVLPEVGAEEFLARVVVMTIIRELGPLLTAFIVIWRSGTSISTELGFMRVDQETTALEAMGIPVIRLLVMPRVIAAVIAVVCLTVYADVVAAIGGFVAAKIVLTVPLAEYLREIEAALSIKDLVVTVLKSSLFGLVIAVICCHHGLSVEKAMSEVPQQATWALLNAVVICLILDIVMSISVYV